MRNLLSAIAVSALTIVSSPSNASIISIDSGLQEHFAASLIEVKGGRGHGRGHGWGRSHGRHFGWSRGRKVGWRGRSCPPGHARKGWC